MFKREIEVFDENNSGRSKGSKELTPAASAATPPNIDEIGKPAIHLVVGGVGTGKSTVAVNLLLEMAEAHDRVGSEPDVLIFSGSQHDPVFDKLEPSRCKIYSLQTQSDFVGELTKRFENAMNSKKKEGEINALPSDVQKILQQRSGSSSTDIGATTKHKPCIIIVDDFAASDLMGSQINASPIARPVQSHRHADMTFIFISQRFKALSPWLRSNARSMVIYPPAGEEDENLIRREIPITRANLKRAFDVCRSEGPHHFIHVDMKNRFATYDFTGNPI